MDLFHNGNETGLDLTRSSRCRLKERHRAAHSWSYGIQEVGNHSAARATLKCRHAINDLMGRWFKSHCDSRFFGWHRIVLRCALMSRLCT
ncbi:hypothetical protein SB5_03115 [Pseudomonas oryzihabitans]|nr:hypothetical protein SB5_03115 [Pseudomonas psychrotolerans]